MGNPGQDEFEMSHIAWACVAAIASMCVASAEPALVFSKDELPEFRERVETGENARVWAEVLARAEALCDPDSPSYASPEKLDAMPAGEVRIVVLAHSFGRRLTDWMETIGFAYQMTGDERFAAHGVALLGAASLRLPVSDPRIAKGFAGARGDIMRGLAVGGDWLGEAMTPEQRQQWAETSAAYVRNILAEANRDGIWWVPYHNFVGVAVGAAGCLALQLREFYPEEADSWLAECTGLVRRWLDEGFDDQGAYFEGTGYSVYGLTDAVLFAEALRRDGGENLFMHPHLLKVPDFYAMSLLPGERVLEARNDAGYAGLGNPLVLRLAEAQESGLAKWLWERCGGGQSPLRIVWDNDVPAVDPVSLGAPLALARHFEGRGLCVFRTGWDRADVMFGIEAGPYYRVTHNQADKGHFTLYGLGHRWAIDSGYGNDQDPEGRAQTVAHNCVLIDGQGQALSGAGLGTNGTIASFEDGPSHGYALADCTEAYNRNSRGTPGAVVQRALRHVLFVRPAEGVPAYAVVLDDIGKDDAEHDFTWLMHTPEDMVITLGEGSALLQPTAASGNAFVETPEGVDEQGQCVWALDIEEPGEYVVWARVRAAGEIASKSDSFFVQMDDGPDIAWHMPTRRDWTWGKVSSGVPHDPVSFDLPAGERVLRFKTREAGAQVDRVVVTCDPEAHPPFVGTFEGIALEAEAGTVTAPMVVVREEHDRRPPRMRLLVNAAWPVRMDVDGYDDHLRVKATVRAVTPEFAAVLLPLPGGVDEPDVSFGRDDAGLTIRVEWPERRDEIAWPLTGDRKPTVVLH